MTVNGRRFTSGTIPFGATVDVTRGAIVLMTTTGTLRVTGAGGATAAFKLFRGTDRGKPIVELGLVKGDFGVCPERRRSGASQVVRAVWGDGKGEFRTGGRSSSATVRGARWLTADRCDGTLTRVARGRVEVRLFRSNRIVIVPAGYSYLAKP